MTGPDQSFLFVDLAGFTALAEAHGDEESANLAREFYAIVGRAAGERDAEMIKTIGDAVMVRAHQGADAVRLALCVVGEIGDQHGFPSVRAAIHTGPPPNERGTGSGPPSTRQRAFRHWPVGTKCCSLRRLAKPPRR